ncbi:glycerophosphodiester phosphodiesterase family protein [Pararhizobium sp. BT-229]|uniref:glycerophosphodiester phosphodiesterase n=1 Tax=Pararhizobium sp. BT-229 TaxID=2986923 RepID=UPI0021F735A3|nr:glycerophosphodiester phosphodiesterase family protein [Pararhizobium sp. BT-229]MCV9967085.1 glycerophosphodiester phosphodiesterase family protein [Pararhizobium sp. BT-229]
MAGLKIESDGHPVRLKWHRLRRQLSDPLFSLDVMRTGFALGASMELDLRVRGDGGFVVLHDEELEGETTGRGRISGKILDELRNTRMRDGERPLTFSEDLAAMLQSAHPDALLQFDMKDEYEAIGNKGIEHLAAHLQDMSASVIVSGHCLDLIVAVRQKLPHLLRGIDPTDKLVDIYRQEGLRAVEKSLLADISGPTEPDTIYLQWSLLLQAAHDGLDMVSLCQSQGKRVDAWTFTLKNPAGGFSDAEWHDFSALMALKPDQITTDEAPATERAWSMRLAG